MAELQYNERQVEAKYKVGMLLSCKHGNLQRVGIAIGVSKTPKTWSYKVINHLGIVQPYLEDIIEEASQEQKEKWKADVSWLRSPDELAKHLKPDKQGPKTTAGLLERIVSYIELTYAEKKEIEEALDSAVENGKLVIEGAVKEGDFSRILAKAGSKLKLISSASSRVPNRAIEQSQPEEGTILDEDVQEQTAVAPATDSMITEAASDKGEPIPTEQATGKSPEQAAKEVTEVGEKLPQEASESQDAKMLRQEQEAKLDEDIQDQTEVSPALTTDSTVAKAALDENEPISAGQITEKSPKQTADELTQAWENLPPEASEAERNKLAEQMRVILYPSPEPSEAAKTVTDFFDFCEADPETHHPLFWILSGQASPMQRRQLIARLGLSTLERYVQWLEKRSSVTNDPVPVSQIEGLLDGLANGFSQAFQGAAREGGVNHYQRIAKSMLILLKMADAEVRGPYEWRLFSFLREGWARTTPHAQAGSNDLSGARDYLKWLLAEKESWPKTIWPDLLISMMREETLDRLHEDTQRRVLQCAAEYALNAPTGLKKSRLLSFQEVLSEKTIINFLQAVSKVSQDNVNEDSEKQ